MNKKVIGIAVLFVSLSVQAGWKERIGAWFGKEEKQTSNAPAPQRSVDPYRSMLDLIEDDMTIWPGKPFFKQIFVKEISSVKINLIGEVHIEPSHSNKIEIEVLSEEKKPKKLKVSNHQNVISIQVLSPGTDEEKPVKKSGRKTISTTTVSQTKNGKVTIKKTTRTAGLFGFFSKKTTVDLSYLKFKIKLPPALINQLEVSSPLGRIQVNGLQLPHANRLSLKTHVADISISYSTLPGVLTTSTHQGKTHLSHLKAKGVEIKSSTGNVQMNTIQATNGILLNTNNSNVSSRTVTGDLNINTQTGNVSIKQATGDVSVQTLIGQIEVSGVKGAVFVETMAGNIQLNNPHAESEWTRTSIGTVRGQTQKSLRLPREVLPFAKDSSCEKLYQ